MDFELIISQECAYRDFIINKQLLRWLDLPTTSPFKPDFDFIDEHYKTEEERNRKFLNVLSLGDVEFISDRLRAAVPETAFGVIVQSIKRGDGVVSSSYRTGIISYSGESIQWGIIKPINITAVAKCLVGKSYYKIGLWHQSEVKAKNIRLRRFTEHTYP